MLQDKKTLKEYGIGKITFSDSKAKMEPAEPVYFHCSLSDYKSSKPSEANVRIDSCLLFETHFLIMVE